MITKVTSKDVARALGISQSTVSRAFNPKASISAKKRDLVLKAAADLGYTPNAIARSLISKRSGLIAIALDSKGNPMYDLLVRRLIVAIQSQGGQAVLCPIDQDNLDLAILRAIEYRVDGLIIATSRLRSCAIARCERTGIHLSVINRYLKQAKANSIGLDNYQTGCIACKHLFEQGFAHLAYVSGDQGSMTSEERWRGFEQTALSLGLPKVQFFQAEYSFEAGLLAAEALFTAQSNVDGVFCGNDILALGLLDGLRQKGVRVPLELGVMGVDNIPMAQWPSYDLTTIGQPIDCIANGAVKDLFERIDGQSSDCGEYVVYPGELIARSSTQRLSG